MLHTLVPLKREIDCWLDRICLTVVEAYSSFKMSDLYICLDDLDAMFRLIVHFFCPAIPPVSFTSTAMSSVVAGYFFSVLFSRIFIFDMSRRKRCVSFVTHI
jgi:hypothetical protein